MTRRIVAILRGISPDEVEAIGMALVGAGISMIEVPLNSPEPLASIEILARSLGGASLVGAGTVLTPQQVDDVASAGGRMIVSPNCRPAVIARTLSLGLASMPGVFTPTECFTALDAGARSIKLFPAEIAGPGGLKAIKAVLPEETEVYAVGGVSAGNCADWAKAGAAGFGIGGALYKPGYDARAVAARAEEIVAAYDAAFGKQAETRAGRDAGRMT